MICHEGKLKTVKELIIHEVAPGVTSRAPPGIEVVIDGGSSSIALIIIWTIILFLVGVLIISLVKKRCSTREEDPFTYKAPSESLIHQMAMRARGSGSLNNKFGLLNEMELSNRGSEVEVTSGHEDNITRKGNHRKRDSTSYY